MIDASKRVLMFGTFDVRNFGDLLFPVVARHYLEREGFEIMAVSPTDMATGWADAVVPLSVGAALKLGGPLAGVLIGGGNIGHTHASRLPDYRGRDLSRSAYPSLWLGAAVFAAARNIPIAWNAIGVPHEFDPAAGNTIIPAVVQASYPAVRDAASRDCFGPHANAIVVVPDTALDLPRVWPRGGLEPEFRTLLQRTAREGEKGYVTVHVKERSLGEQDAAGVAAAIDRMASETGLTPILVAIGPCHGDDVFARRLSKLLTRAHILLDAPLGLREIAAAIAFSEHYVGASLHGFITAYAYGTPGSLVGVPPLPKFSGLLDHVGRLDDLAEDWDEALGRIRTWPKPVARPPALPDAVRESLDQHWRSVAAAYLDPSNSRAGRIGLLRTFVRYGIHFRGIDWALSPFVAM